MIPLLTKQPTGRSIALNFAGGLFLSAIWLLFAYRHVTAFVITGQYALLLFCISETLQAALFVCRRHPATVSAVPLDWLIAVCGTLAPLFFIPIHSAGTGIVDVLIGTAITLQILGLVSLNRSFGIVPAKRSIKTSGMYRFVRHPMYASYLLLFSGYLLGNTTTWNLVVYVFSVCFMLLRILREERHLSADPEYRQYASRVHYRLVPYLY
jgi:protein-S-isoprenylcysteine O-methyltransferase Ste14